MQHILFLEALSTISGGQRVLLDAIPALRSSYRLSVALPGNGPLNRALSQLGLFLYDVSGGNYTLVRKSPKDVLTYAIRLPWLVWLTWRLVQQQNVDLIYANSGRTFVWGTLAAMLAHRPIIWHHHNLIGDGKTLALLRFLGRFPAVRRIICVSHAARRQFPILAAKTVVVPTGVDTEKFHPDKSLGASVRQALGIPATAQVVGIVGDLIPLKGQHILLEALASALPDVYCLVVGSVRPGDTESSDYFEHLQHLAPDNVIFTGRREDIVATLNAFDLLVIASERETGPLVLLEALACGVPVISTPVGRAPDLLSPENLYPVGDAVALAKRLRFHLEDMQRRQLAGELARRLAEAQLTLAQFCARIRAEIEQVCANEV